MATRTSKAFSSVKGKDIVLDTCIFRYLADAQLRPVLQKDLREFKKNGNRLAVCQMTHFEIYRRVLTKAEDSFYGRVLFAKELIKLELNYRRVANAAVLGRMCNPSRIIRGSLSAQEQDKHIVADLLIGGTVIENQSAALMTANRKDFPEPFWKVIGEKHFLKKKIEGWEGITIYILEFDHSVGPKKLKAGK